MDIIQKLAEKIEELSFFVGIYNCRAEPYRYPKGLFRVSTVPIKRDQFAAYISELKHDVERLRKVERTEASILIISQKINVLVNSIRAQTPKKKNPQGFEAVLNGLDLQKESVWQKILLEK